jgi:hypothetical protein
MRYVAGHNIHPIDPVARFWQHVEKRGPDDCWLWLAAHGPLGHGVHTVAGRNVPAHRFSWELVNGPIPPGYLMTHHCPGGDNPACVNPAHLKPLTPKEHAADRVAKGQQATGDRHGSRVHPECLRRGEQLAHSKLTEVQVRALREQYAAGGSTYEALGQEFGIGPVQAWRIVKRHRWGHIK